MSCVVRLKIFRSPSSSGLHGGGGHASLAQPNREQSHLSVTANRDTGEAWWGNVPRCDILTIDNGYASPSSQTAVADPRAARREFLHVCRLPFFLYPLARVRT